MKLQVFILFCVLATTQATLLPADENKPQGTQPQPKDRQPKINSANSENQGYNCFDVLVNDPDFECSGEPETSPKITMDPSKGFTVFDVHKKKTNRDNFSLKVYPHSDPAVLARMKKSFEDAKSIKDSILTKLFQVKATDSYVMVVEDSPNGDYQFFVQMPMKFENYRDREYREISRYFATLTNIRKLHKLGWVGVDFTRNFVDYDSSVVKLNNFRCLTRLGGDIGRCPTESLQIDPRVKLSPPPKADKAMDYFVFGASLYEDFFGPGPRVKFLDQLKENMSTNTLTFQKGLDPIWALFISVLMQNDVTRRTDDEVINHIKFFIGDRTKGSRNGLQRELKVSLAENPLKVPEFQADVEAMMLNRKATNDDSDYREGWSTSAFIWLAVGVIGVVLLGVGLYFVLRKKESEEPTEKAPEVTQELQVEPKAD